MDPDQAKRHAEWAAQREANRVARIRLFEELRLLRQTSTAMAEAARAINKRLDPE